MLLSLWYSRAQLDKVVKQPLGMRASWSERYSGGTARQRCGFRPWRSWLHDAVLSAAIDLKAVGWLLDRLMVHAVGLYFGRAGDALKDASPFSKQTVCTGWLKGGSC